MSNDTIVILMGVIALLFFVIVVAYLFIRKRLQNSDVARIEKLRNIVLINLSLNIKIKIKSKFS